MLIKQQQKTNKRTKQKQNNFFFNLKKIDKLTIAIEVTCDVSEG